MFVECPLFAQYIVHCFSLGFLQKQIPGEGLEASDKFRRGSWANLQGCDTERGKSANGVALWALVA